MRVVHLTRDFPPAHCGGITTAVRGLVAATARAGVENRVLSWERARPQQRDASATEAPEPGARELLRVATPEASDSVVAWVRAAAADVIHLHDPLLLELAQRSILRPGARLVFTVHVDHEEAIQRRAPGPANGSLVAMRQALAIADAIVVPSATAAQRLVAVHPGIAERVRVVGHGIASAKDVIESASREPVLAHVGRFDADKGTADFLEAAGRVLAARPGARAVLAGGLPANPKAERRWLRRWREQWPDEVATRLTFVGWLPPTELGHLYRQAGVVAIPSYWETFGLTALEAMHQAAPIVATARGGLGELLQHGETALVIEAGDIEGLTRGMIHLLDHPTEAARLGGAAAAAAAARDWDAVLPSILALYAGPARSDS